MKNRVVGLTCAHTAEASQHCNKTQKAIIEVLAGSVMKLLPQHMAPLQLWPEPWLKNRVVGLTCAHRQRPVSGATGHRIAGIEVLAQSVMKPPGSRPSKPPGMFIAAYTAACQHGSGSASGAKTPQHHHEL